MCVRKYSFITDIPCIYSRYWSMSTLDPNTPLLIIVARLELKVWLKFEICLVSPVYFNLIFGQLLFCYSLMLFCSIFYELVYEEIDPANILSPLPIRYTYLLFFFNFKINFYPLQQFFFEFTHCIALGVLQLLTVSSPQTY